MHKFIAVFIYLIFFSFSAWSLHIPKILNKDQLFNPNESHINALFIGLKNDNYFLLDDFSENISNAGDDFGQTHAFTAEYIRKSDSRFHSINFETALFTRAVNTQFQGDKKVVTQKFREVSVLEYSFHKLIQENKYWFIVGEAGLINDTKPIWGLALWQQSGKNGDGGFHDLVNMDTKLYSQNTGGREFYFGTEIGFGKILPFGIGQYSFFNRIQFTTEAKIRLRTKFEGSHFTGVAKGAYNLVKHLNKRILTLNIQEELHYYFEETYTGSTTTLGLQYDWTQLGAQMNLSYPFGKQNERFYKFADKDVMLVLNLYYFF